MNEQTKAELRTRLHAMIDSLIHYADAVNVNHTMGYDQSIRIGDIYPTLKPNGTHTITILINGGAQETSDMVTHATWEE